MSHCVGCGKDRALIWKPQTPARRLCADCWLPVYEPPSLPDQIDALGIPGLREGEPCLRVVENLDEFGLLFLWTDSNVEALRYAVGVWGAVSMSARPVEPD